VERLDYLLGLGEDHILVFDDRVRRQASCALPKRHRSTSQVDAKRDRLGR
jgi:hypothetical protein